MRISRTTLLTAFSQPMQALIVALAHNQTRIVLDRLNPTPMTDNSTGVASAIVAVPTQANKGKQAGTNLASRAAFNTAIGKVNDAVAVIAAYLSANGATAMQLEGFTGGNGNVAAAGTIPALDKTVGAGVDGSAGGAMLRLEANQAIVRQRNNLATLLRVYNAMAGGVGVATLPNNTLGNASNDSAIGNSVTAPTAIPANAVAGADLALKANMDAALDALANDVATVASKINTVLLADATLAGIEPVILIP